jgi:LysR family cys regulon transcriptional activator
VPNVADRAGLRTIATYVEGFGVGIIAKMAWDPGKDAGTFEQLDAAHLFAPSITKLALRRGTFLRGYVYDFIARFAPALDHSAVDAALAGPAPAAAR